MPNAVKLGIIFYKMCLLYLCKDWYQTEQEHNSLKCLRFEDNY